MCGILCQRRARPPAGRARACTVLCPANVRSFVRPRRNGGCLRRRITPPPSASPCPGRSCARAPSPAPVTRAGASHAHKRISSRRTSNAHDGHALQWRALANVASAAVLLRAGRRAAQPASGSAASAALRASSLHACKSERTRWNSQHTSCTQLRVLVYLRATSVLRFAPLQQAVRAVEPVRRHDIQLRSHTQHIMTRQPPSWQRMSRRFQPAAARLEELVAQRVHVHVRRLARHGRLEHRRKAS
jgi:hypothetical protein